MNYTEQSKEDYYQEIRDSINRDSTYKKKEPREKKYMTVLEMGNLLGLRKTDRYWLVHKGFFKTDVIAGRMMVEISSFEKWYANQIKYKKITGEEPGLELKKESYSARDISEMLGIPEWKVYEEMRNGHVEYILVDYWKRFPKDAYEEWYKNQHTYYHKEDRAKIDELLSESMTMPEMARMLGIDRHVVYDILRNNSEYFEYTYIGERKRVLKEGFYNWYQTQSKYRIVADNTKPLSIEEEEHIGIEVLRRRIYDRDQSGKNIGNKDNLTIREAALLADVDIATISKWIQLRYFPVVSFAHVVRIPRTTFEQWISKRKEH